MGLEKMRKQNRMRSRGKHYPYAHETNTNISLQSIQTRAYNLSSYRYKRAQTILFTWGNSTIDMVADWKY